MTPHSMSSSGYVNFGATSAPWGEEIWQEGDSWFTLAQLLLVKLLDSSMSYGQLHYVISAPVTSRIRDDRSSAVYEMELVMDSERGILLIAEVYGQPGDPMWQPDKIYRGLLELGNGLSELLQRELFDDHYAAFGPGFVLVLRDVERCCLSDDNLLNQPNVITRDELRTIRYRLDKIMDSYSKKLDIPFRNYGHLLIAALRNIGHNSQAEIGGFRTADEIYHKPRLPAWLR